MGKKKSKKVKEDKKGAEPQKVAVAAPPPLLQRYAVVLLALFPGNFQNALRGVDRGGNPTTFYKLSETDPTRLAANISGLETVLSNLQYPRGIVGAHLELLRLVQANPHISSLIRDMVALEDNAYKGDHPPDQEGRMILSRLSQ